MTSKRSAASPRKPPRVFISYSHDSREHSLRVLALADRLRRDGVDAWIDQYEAEPEQGWERWMVDEIEKASRVLTICTETYRRRFEGKETEGGLGVDWEGAILTGQLYRRRRRFVTPVVFSQGDLEHLPTVLGSLSYFVVDGEGGYLDLYRLLTGQPKAPAPKLGEVRKVLPQARRSVFHFSTPAASPDPAPDPVIDEYVEKARSRYRYLDLIGLGAGDLQVELERIYVPLRIEGRGMGTGEVEPEEQSAREKPRNRRFQMVADAHLELERIFLYVPEAEVGRHALLLGDAGAGKSTALRKLHQLALDSGIGGAEALGLAPQTLPVFLRLRQWTPELLEKGVEDWLQTELEELFGGRLAGDLGDRLWQHRRLLLLCDGLDEIADEDHRLLVLRRLVWELEKPGSEDVRVVVSCRNAGWTKALSQLPLEGFLHRGVRPFEDEQITQLVKMWFHEVADSGPITQTVAEQRAADLLTGLEEAERRDQKFLRIIANPLLLTLLCIVVMRGGEIPRRRTEFYEKCLEILVREWRQRQAERRPPVPPEQALRLLGGLAWYLHSQHRKDDLGSPEALLLIKREVHDARLARAVFRWLLEDVAVLEGFSESHYGFVHLGFQEHLAARHLAVHAELLDQACAEWDDSWWLEVFQLLAGLPGVRGFAPLMRRLLATEAPLGRAELLSACLDEAADPDLEPFYEVLDDTGQPERKIVTVLSLLRGRREQELMDRVGRLATSESKEVAAMARQVEERAAVTEAPSMRDVFLLHSSADRRPAQRLARSLRGHAMTVDSPREGERWDALGVIDRLVSCRSLVVLLGEGELDFKQVLHSIAFAEVEAWVVSLPGDPRPQVPEALGHLAHVDLPGWKEEAAVDRLVAELRSVASESPPPERQDDDLAVPSPTRGGRLALGRLAEKALQVAEGQPFTEPVTGEIFLPVPGGRFQMGGTVYSDEQPIHWVRLSPFWLARTPVTNRQYRLFLEDTGHDEPGYWRDRRFSEPEQPVVGVSWHDAVAYCQWLSGRTPAEGPFTLPSEAQWEFVARGTDGREYPWGNEAPDDERACFGLAMDSGKPAAVGSYPAGEGPFGQLDLAGNVLEWCLDAWEEDYQRWSDSEPLDPVGTADEDFRALRGGAWWAGAGSLRSAVRDGFGPGDRDVSFGFRVCRSSPSTVSGSLDS